MTELLPVRQPKLLDLFCCEGGASRGYADVGFHVVGVDIKRQPRYPFVAFVADALDFLEAFGHEFDAIHASPPCHDHSTLSKIAGPDGTGWLLADTRRALAATGRPYVIENVIGAPMVDPVVLCGSMFDLGVLCRDDVYRQLRRHRQFESNIPITAPRPCNHVGSPVGVYGNGGGQWPLPRADGKGSRSYMGTALERVGAMGIDWMSRAGLSQALPPAYTRHIGAQLLAAVNQKEAA